MLGKKRFFLSFIHIVIFQKPKHNLWQWMNMLHSDSWENYFIYSNCCYWWNVFYCEESALVVLFPPPTQHSTHYPRVFTNTQNELLNSWAIVISIACLFLYSWWSNVIGKQLLNIKSLGNKLFPDCVYKLDWRTLLYKLSSSCRLNKLSTGASCLSIAKTNVCTLSLSLFSW